MKFERLEGSQVKAFFTIKRSDFELALDTAFEINNEKVTIKGFRKGKAPKAKYLAAYGVESLYSDALDAAVNKIIETELVPCTEFRIINGPTLDLDYEKIATEEDLEINLTFDVHPTFELGTYKGIEVKAEDTNVTDEDITNAINGALKDKIEVVVKKDQVIANGDVAIFDFVGSVDGVEFEGGTAENYQLKIGSGQFIPGFEDQMMGMKASEVKDVNVTFPEQYHAEDLAGKKAVFKVTLHEVKEEIVPTLSDEIVASLEIENVKTVSEYNTHIVDKLKESKQQNETRRQEEEVLKAVINNTTIELPRSYVESRTNELMAGVENQAKQYGIPLEMFLQFSGMDLETFKKQSSERAVNDVKLDCILSEVVKVENIVATEDEITSFIASEAVKYNAKPAQFEKQYGRSVFAYNLNVNKALELIKTSSKIK